MIGDRERPWLEIPIPSYIPLHDPEDYNPSTKKDDNTKSDDSPDESERKVIIIEL